MGYDFSTRRTLTRVKFRRIAIFYSLLNSNCLHCQEDVSWRVRGRGQLSHAVELACGAAQRLRTLELQWPFILVDMIEEILMDFTDMETHVKEQMRVLMDSMCNNN